MRRLPKLGLLIVTAASVWFIAAHLPGLREVRGWFYAPRASGLGEAWAVALFATLVPALCWAGLALTARGRGRAGGIALLGGALAAQLLFIPIDSSGLDTVWRRHVHGHGEFVRIAASRRGQFVETLRNYETLVERGELGVFAPSKPPGALAAYMGLDALARWDPLQPLLQRWARDAEAFPGIGPERARTAALSLFVMPLLTALTVLPLLGLGMRVFGHSAAAHGAALLYLTAPAVLLISHHLDGALYPLLAVTACWLAATGLDRNGLAWSALGGLVLGFGWYVSFSLVPVLGLVAGSLAWTALRHRRLGTARLLFRAGWHAAAVGAGTVAAVGILWLALDFQPGLRLERALVYHAQWKAGVPMWPWRGWALAELSLYAGVPLMAALLVLAGAGLGRLRRRELEPRTLAAVGLVLFVLVLSLAAGTNEVARLWLFLVPFLALCVAAGLPRAARAGRWHVPLAWLAACQGGLALVLEANQPW